jgi:hypothetical protein
MRDRPSSIHTCRSVMLAALVATSCASTAGQETVAEQSGKETPRSLLEATTPAAAAQADPASTSGGNAADSAQPGRMLIYSAITGHVPLRDKAHDPADRYRSPAEREASRARSIEAEIEEELARQEQLDVTETATAPSPPEPTDPGGSPLTASTAPKLKELPERIFETQEVAISPGTWQNTETLYLERRSLDVDKDGKPEEVRYVETASGQLVRSEQDLDYDGSLDAWTTYQGGEAAVRILDTSGDGRPDVWERYQDGRMSERVLDRDADGVRDTFYYYEGELLARRSTDQNNDGTADKLETFEQRRRVRSEEDRSLNGQIDTWTTYGTVGGREVVERIERDSRDSGRPDLIEIYETVDGETRLTRREEDVNGDGTIDVVSTYQDGRLVQRAISDEALSPL